jgi:PAS domain S-box-containing protein
MSASPTKFVDSRPGPAVEWLDWGPLEQAEERLASAVGSMPVVLFALDRDGTVTLLQGSGRLPLGLRPEDCLGRSVFEAFNDAPELVDDLAGALEGEAIGSVIQVDGRAFGLQCAPLHEREGEILGALGVIFDITEHRDAEEQLKRTSQQLQSMCGMWRENEQRYRALVEHNPLMMFTIDPESGTVLSVNPTGAEQLGYEIGELVGGSVFKVFHEKDRDEVREAVRECLQNPSRVAHWEFRKVRKDGSMLWVRESCRPVRGDDGRMMMLVVCEDITEYRQTQEALRASEKRYRLVSQVTSDVIWNRDLRTYRVEWSDSVRTLFGYRPDQLGLDNNWWAARIHPEDRERVTHGLHQLVENGGRFWSVEYRFLRADGNYSEVVDRGYVIINDAGEPLYMVGAMLDVTDRNQSQRAFLHAQKLESLGVLAGGIAHDFNNLLMGILVEADLAHRAAPPGSKLEASLRRIEKAGDRAADLCKQLLAYSGRGRFDVRPIELNALIQELASLMKLSIRQGVFIDLRLGSDVPSVLADSAQVQQVVMNLIMNAAEAMPDGQGTISISTRKCHAGPEDLSSFCPKESFQKGEYALLEVSDCGCGMDAETVEKMFDPFFTTKFTGRGLGLAAVLGIVRGHGAGLKVESEPGVGTTFKIFFPLCGTDEPALATDQPPPHIQESWTGSGTVLVVDDEDVVRMVTSEMLSEMGFESVTAADGFTACERLKENPDRICAVLLDLTMPRMDGVETLGELRKIKPDIKVIVMSGYDEVETIDRFTNGSLDAFLQKPFVGSQLQAKLKTLLQQK